MRGALQVVAVAVLFLWSAVAVAQTEALPVDDPVYPFWADVARDAEATIDNASGATVDDLVALRARLVNFRNEFSNLREANAERIANLESQIAALGPVPEDVAEPEEIVEQRADLRAQLETLLAPVRVADVAFRRADGLIGEIDTELRERQARRLLSLGPSLLDVRIWPDVYKDVARSLRDILVLPDPVTRARNRATFANRLPLILLLTAVSLTLIIKGRSWANEAVNYMRRFGGSGSGVWSFLASLLRIFVPLLGVYLFTYAARLAEVLNPKVEIIVGVLPVYGLILLGFYWLGERLFSRNNDEALLPYPAGKRRLARFYILLFSLLFIASSVVEIVFSLDVAAAETAAVLAFPAVALTSVVLFFMGRLLRSKMPSPDCPEGEAQQKTGVMRAIRIMGAFMIAVSVVAPAMAAIGYAEAGNALLYPTLLSALLLGLVMVLQRFISDVYGLVTGQGLAARDGLFAVLAGFVLILAVLPILALVWGARVTDLTELWTQFMQGFDIAGAKISPSNFMIFAIVFAIGYGVTRLLQTTLRYNVLPKTRLDIGGQNALVSGTGYVGVMLAGLIAVTIAGLDLSGFALVAGALSVGIGFGLQTIVSNFVSGIILLVERPISEGDWIEVGGQMGYVKGISVRSTRIETFDRTDVIVPNSDLISGTVTNYTRGNTIGRLIVKVGVAYGTDTKKVDKILNDIAKDHPMIVSNPPPAVLFMGFGADSLDFEIRAILRDVNWVLNVQNDINHAIAARFTEEGVEIPFAQRDIWLRNPEALRGQTDTAAAADESPAPDDLGGLQGERSDP